MLWVITGWPVLPIITYNYTTGWEAPTSMLMPCQGCPGLCVHPISQAHTPELLQQQCRQYKRHPWVLLRHPAVTCVSWDLVEDSPQVTCITADDWQQAQWTDPILGQVIVRMQDGTLDQCPYKPTDPPELQQLLWEWNHLKLRQSYTEMSCQGSPRRNHFNWYCQPHTGRPLWRDVMMGSAT